MPTNRLKPINLRLPEKLIDESDQLAQAMGSTRSELVRSALRSYIERRRRLQAVYTLVEHRGKAAGIRSAKDIENALAEVRAKRQSR